MKHGESMKSNANEGIIENKLDTNISRKTQRNAAKIALKKIIQNKDV